jgi:hypothetical protein
LAAELKLAAPIMSVFKGIFGNRSKSRFGSITDGTSNTLMFGEVTGVFEAKASIPDSWAGFQKRQGRQREFLYNHGGLPIELHHPWYETNTNWAHQYRFSSNHSGKVINWSVADGSVQTLSNNVDFTVLEALSGMDDGTVASIPN